MFKKIKNQLHVVLIEAAERLIVKLVRKHVNNTRHQELIELFLGVSSDLATLLTDDDKDNSKQIEEYFETNATGIIAALLSLITASASPKTLIKNHEDIKSN